eukprot:6287869-Amphidinium_carterae.1
MMRTVGSNCGSTGKAFRSDAISPAASCAPARGRKILDLILVAQGNSLPPHVARTSQYERSFKKPTHTLRDQLELNV